jgi:hypothetical protein
VSDHERPVLGLFFPTRVGAGIDLVFAGISLILAFIAAEWAKVDFASGDYAGGSAILDVGVSLVIVASALTAVGLVEIVLIEIRRRGLDTSDSPSRANDRVDPL